MFYAPMRFYMQLSVCARMWLCAQTQTYPYSKMKNAKCGASSLWSFWLWLPRRLFPFSFLSFSPLAL